MTPAAWRSHVIIPPQLQNLAAAGLLVSLGLICIRAFAFRRVGAYACGAGFMVAVGIGSVSHSLQAFESRQTSVCLLRTLNTKRNISW